jgi:hypothetical protein
LRRKRFMVDCFIGKLCFDQYEKNIFPPKYISLNLCWNRLCDIKFDENRIAADLAEVDIGKWISSLACCNNEECKDFLLAIVGDRPAYTALDKALCPPGCGCDNPWQFLS